MEEAAFNKKTQLNFILRMTLVILAISSPTCFAYSAWIPPRSWHPIIAVTGSALTTTDQNDTTTFPIVDPIVDSFYIYEPNDTTNSLVIAEVFLGVEWCFQNLGFQVGLAYNQSRAFSYEGTLTQGADVQSQDVFTYEYDLRLRQALVEGKLLFYMNKFYHPYLLAGIGAAFNSASGFTTNVPPFLTFTRSYSHNTVTSFSYVLGFGIDIDLDQVFRVGVGYRFADYGKAELGDAVIDDTAVSGTLSMPHLYTNQLFAQITCALW